MNKKRLLPVCLVSLVGCSSIQLEKIDPITSLTPEVWEHQQNLPAAPLSWQQFNDATLTELIKTALTNSPNIRSALLSLESAQLQNRSTHINNGINYGITANASTSGRRSAGFSESYGLNGQASYELDLWGKKDDILKAADLSLASSELSMKTARISLAASVTTSYYDLRLQDKRIKFQQTNLANNKRQLAMVQKRHELGFVTQIDVNNKELEIKSAEAAIVAAQERRDLAELRLANLLGVKPAELKIPRDDNLVIPNVALAPNLPAEVLRNRPDIQTAEIALQQSYIRFEQAKDVYFPNITLTASTGFSSNKLVGLLDTLNPWSLSASLASITLLDNGARERSIEQSRISAEQQIVSYQQSILNALEDVESALTEQAAGLRQMEIRQEQLRIQRLLTEQTKVRYKIGAVSAFDLTNQERALISAEEAILQQQLTNLQASIRMLRALGVEPELPNSNSGVAATDSIES